MEQYYETRGKQFQEGIKINDRDEAKGLPRGLNFAYNEKMPSYEKEKEQLKDAHRAATPTVPKADPAWRFAWKLKSKDNIIP